jgi:hypothetical protein
VTDADDLVAELRVGEHGLLLSARACGMLPAGQSQAARPVITSAEAGLPLLASSSRGVQMPTAGAPVMVLEWVAARSGPRSGRGG